MAPTTPKAKQTICSIPVVIMDCVPKREKMDEHQNALYCREKRDYSHQ